VGPADAAPDDPIAIVKSMGHADTKTTMIYTIGGDRRGKGGWGAAGKVTV